MTSPNERVVTLRDGSHARVRPIQPDDKDALIAGLQKLSPESRYLRFLRPVTSLNERELKYLTEIDYTNHFAWVAADPDDDLNGYGVARYVRDPKDPEVAEAAVAINERGDSFNGPPHRCHLIRNANPRLPDILFAEARIFAMYDNGDNLKARRRDPDHEETRFCNDYADVIAAYEMRSIKAAIIERELGRNRKYAPTRAICQRC